MDENLIGSKINDYIITKYISSGSFGKVYRAKHYKTNYEVALKIPIKTEEKNGEKWLLEEAKVYNELNNSLDENYSKDTQDQNDNDNIGIVKTKVISSKELNKKIIVMDLLGPSLESLIAKKKKIGLKSVIILCIQMIQTMKFIHDTGYIHRDIKPDNFVMDLKCENKLYCIDFGLSKKYVKKNGDHNSFKKGHRFCGTARYASISAHKGYEQSRRDDLESICYILVYLYKGKLPWQGIKDPDKIKRYDLIKEKKENIKEEELFDKLPREFCVFFKHVKTLDFEERPRYTALINMFKKLYKTKDYKNDKLEWE